MHDVKDAFLAQDALAVVVALVSQPLMRHADGHMTDRDVLIVQLVVTFLRNLIVIPDSGSTSGAAHVFIVRHNCASRLIAAIHWKSSSQRGHMYVPDILGSSGSHKSRMSSKLLSRFHEDSVFELLLVMAQHTSRVRVLTAPCFLLFILQDTMLKLPSS